MSVKTSLCLILSLFVLKTYGQTPCKDGTAGAYDCFGIDLQTIIGPQELGAENIGDRWVNDLWGWTDPMTDKEYALVGMTNGVSFVDISDPVNPVVLGVLKEHNWDQVTSTNRESHDGLHEGAKTLWRDIKVYENYAYVVAEDPNHGIQVFDLTELRDVTETPADFQEAGHYDGVGKAHNVFINEESGFLYAVGFNQGDRTCSEGGLHMVDLSNPTNPVYAGCYDDKGYIHDTQCVTYIGPDSDYSGKEICFNSNGNGDGPNTITIVDVSNKTTPVLIAEGEYENAFYSHQGWLTEDHKYFLSNDELDEANTGNNTKTFIWDVRNLDEPTLIGTYTHSTKAIDHNLYIKGDLVYESNYTNGLRVLDASQIADGTLEEIMFFDVHPTDDETSFYGTWSNYPFFESGNIIVSDFTRGLFILKPQANPGELTLSVDLKSQIHIFPNPASDQISIRLSSPVKQALGQLMSIDGRVVLSQELSDSENVMKLDGIKTGLYLLKIKMSDGERLQKVMIR